MIPSTVGNVRERCAIWPHKLGFVDAKDQLLEMAEDYDRLAKTAEEQSKNAPWPPR